MCMKKAPIFNEAYRVIAVDDQSLVVRGVRSGEVLTIYAADFASPFNRDDYPVGQLMALTAPNVEVAHS